MIKVLVLTDFSSGYSRNLLKGMVKYSQEEKEISFYRMPLFVRMMKGDAGVAKWAKEWNADAVIAQLQDVDISCFLDVDIPIIVQNFQERLDNVCNLTGDYYGTGEMAANFFIKRGFKNFAFYGTTESIWSRERFLGYKNKLINDDYNFYEYHEPTEGDNRWSYDFDNLAKWLRMLPKPTALFACDDHYAVNISETCKMININIPNEVSLLGVDNDELLCKISNPPLSSIMLDVEYGGYLAAKTIAQLVHKEIDKPSNIIIKGLQIIKRESTEKFVINDLYILKVVEYIEANLCNIISMKDILDLVPMSRRVLEIKFRKSTGTSIHQYIQSSRLDKVANMLVESFLPIELIATKCGFTSNQQLSSLFGKYKGITPSQYRKKYQITTES